MKAAYSNLVDIDAAARGVVEPLRSRRRLGSDAEQRLREFEKQRLGWLHSLCIDGWRSKLQSNPLRSIETFPRKVRGTADPSAALGMTKGRAMLPWKAVSRRRCFSSPWVAQAMSIRG